MEKAKPTRSIANARPKSLQAELNRSGIKVSLNLLYYIFGRNSFFIYNYLNKKRKSSEIIINSPVMDETKKMFEKKAKGFYTFVNDFVEKIKQLKNSEKIVKDEEILDFPLEIQDLDKLHSKSRYILTKNEEIFRLKQEKAIFLQKNIRRFISYVHFLKMFNEYLKEKIESNVIIIQKTFRKFYSCKRVKSYYLKYRIFTTIKKSKTSIKNTIERYFNKTSFKKLYILQSIINSRTEAIKLLQNKITFFLFHKKIKALLYKEKTSYFLSYPFVANEVKLIVFINKQQHSNSLTYEIKEKVYTFEFCKIRNSFVLHINPEDFNPGKYRVKMIVDNLVTCDGRFPHIEFSDGYYYNIIDFSVKNRNNTDAYSKSPNQAYTRVETSESEKKRECLDCTDKSIKDNSNSCSGNSFVRELLRKRNTSFDMELKENLENKKAYSYVDLIKESVLNDSNDNNFD